MLSRMQWRDHKKLLSRQLEIFIPNSLHSWKYLSWVGSSRFWLVPGLYICVRIYMYTRIYTHHYIVYINLYTTDHFRALSCWPDANKTLTEVDMAFTCMKTNKFSPHFARKHFHPNPASANRPGKNTSVTEMIRDDLFWLDSKKKKIQPLSFSLPLLSWGQSSV